MGGLPQVFSHSDQKISPDFQAAGIRPRLHPFVLVLALNMALIKENYLALVRE